MLKHASPLRSSTSSTRSRCSSATFQMNEDSPVLHSQNSLLAPSKLPQNKRTQQKIAANSNFCLSNSRMSPLTNSSTSDKFNERGVDCDGLIPSSASRRTTLSEHMDPLPTNSWGIGPVITHGKAIVRRGLSFTLRREVDMNSVRSVKSEGLTHLQSKMDNININHFNGEIITSDTPFVKNCNDTSYFQSSNNSKSISKSTNSKVSDLQKSYESDSLRSLLRMPGIHAEVRLPDSAVTSSPTILNPDTMSLTSADSLATSSSGRTSSRSWGSSAAASTSSQSSDASSGSSTENTSVSLHLLLLYYIKHSYYKPISFTD